MRVICCSLILIFAFPFSAHGTAVLVVQTEDNSIYLAADAALTRGETGEIVDRICKLHRFDGKTYWAVGSDFFLTKDFSVEKTVASIGLQGTLHEKMQRFIVAVTQPLRGQVAKLDFISPKESALYFSLPRVSVLDIAIVGFENGKTTWAVTRFFAKKVKSKIYINPEPEVTNSENAGKTTIINGAAFWGPAGEYVKTHLLEFYANPTNTLTHALEKSASDDPHHGVGGPYAIVHISALGRTWDQQGECSGD